MTLHAEAHHRSTGGARIVLRNEDHVPVAELVLDSPALAIEALEALSIAMGGGYRYGLLITSPYGGEHVTELHGEMAARTAVTNAPAGQKAEVVRAACGPYLTESERTPPEEKQ